MYEGFVQRPIVFIAFAAPVEKRKIHVMSFFEER